MQETGVRNGAFGADKFGLKNLKQVHWNLGAPQLYQYALSAGEAVLSAATFAALDHASGKIASAALAAMEEQFPWFGRMPADQRASVLFIAQTGAAGFTAWLRDPTGARKLTTDAFRSAPQDLSRWISLRQTVELVRVALQVLERQVPELAADGPERQVLTEAVLRYGATEYAFFRSQEDRLKFTQLAFFESRLDFERYWYSEEISQARIDVSGWYQVPVLPIWHTVVGAGHLLSERSHRAEPGVRSQTEGAPSA